MSDTMRVQPFEVRLRWILEEYAHAQTIFGLHRSLFHIPRPEAPYALELFGRPLGTPIGPAAGPHTQLAQNIVCAWLCGGRFIELKTVQILDELVIPRPCIDMEDEGYNVEWSQELRLEQSAWEYIQAWALIHILHRFLGFPGQPDTVFNMSVGYNLEGIQSPRMVRFMERLADASEEIAFLKDILRRRFPQFADVAIPPRVVESVTLSTMHGCPPEEIERIARYLLEERGLHTLVKLNPTLLGKEEVLHILHERLGFAEIRIPDAVFEHDLAYDRAVSLIRSLLPVAAGRGLTFGVKLSNTLAMANHKGLLPGEEMYMSGRALYPITLNLFRKLAREFGELPVSYSAGADAFNIATLLSCRARPVTAVSDLLKPGGYARLGQYLEELEKEMLRRGAASLDDLARNWQENLEAAADEALENPRYKKSYFPYGLPKVTSPLGLFDCVEAPCVEACPVHQDVPTYAYHLARGEDDLALEAILAHNPLPAVTGYICTHLCQTRCTRNNYEAPVAIRALKRFAAEHGRVPLAPAPETGRRVAVIGSGPSGLAAAFFLALSGVQVTIFEAKGRPGGMPALAPAFRLPPEVLQADLERILSLGVQLDLGHPVAVPPAELLDRFDAVYVAYGFPEEVGLDIPGIEGMGVYPALELLERVARGEGIDLGRRVVVIGGGNTAMDAARTARRLSGRPVTLLYRRTRAEMPAEPEEVAAFLAEGNTLMELASPKAVLREAGRVVALECLRNRLGEPGPDGRPRPFPIPGSEFRLEADAVILAVGQSPERDFLERSGLALNADGTIRTDPMGRTSIPRVYAGGDAVRGPETVIAACADGRRAAEAVCQDLGLPFCPPPLRPAAPSPEEVVRLKRARARRTLPFGPELLPPEARHGFACVEQPLSPEAARAEASRCLQCATLCDTCVEVCPNRANLAYPVSPRTWRLPLLACRDGRLEVCGEERFEIVQPRQILHLDDFCNECGNCATFCVHPGRPYREKPRLFLEENAFLREENNAFYIAGRTIRRREGGREARLTLEGEEAVFEDARLRLRLAEDFALREATLNVPFAGTFSLRPAAEMRVILEGVLVSLPFLANR
ncbi:MAG: putative selenate reductase subunit YgfK [Chloroflexia bacterium]